MEDMPGRRRSSVRHYIFGQHEHCILTYFQLLDIARHSLAHICVASDHVTTQRIHLVWRSVSGGRVGVLRDASETMDMARSTGDAGVPSRLEFQAILLNL